MANIGTTTPIPAFAPVEISPEDERTAVGVALAVVPVVVNRVGNSCSANTLFELFVHSCVYSACGPSYRGEAKRTTTLTLMGLGGEGPRGYEAG
jgi:hypothetical protein